MIQQELGFARIAVGVPPGYVASPEKNARAHAAMTREAAEKGVQAVGYGELGVTQYTCGQYFESDELLDQAEVAVGLYAELTKDLPILSFIGAPVRVGGQLQNMSIGICMGNILAMQPKDYLAEGGIFYEYHFFNPGTNLARPMVRFLGVRIPVCSNTLYEIVAMRNFIVSSEICQAVWTNIPPSAFHTLNGATVIFNLSSSPAAIAKADYRRDLVRMRSGSAYCAYGYASTSSCTMLHSAAADEAADNAGECTQDFVNDGDAFICENGSMAASVPEERFLSESQLIIADVDVDKLVRERRRDPSWGQQEREFRRDYYTVEVKL